jgi:fibronectin-binding autotransporter adhesin
MKTRLSQSAPLPVIARDTTDASLVPLSRLAGACLVVFGILTGNVASAQTPDTWTGGAVGGGNSFWNAAGNWNNGVPAAETPLVFDGTTGLLSTNNLTISSPGFPVPSVTFNATAGSFYLYGNGFPLVMSNSAPGLTVGITNDSTSASQWFGTNFGLSLSNSINVFDAGGGIVLSNPVAANAASAINGKGGITNAGPGTLVLGWDSGWSLFSGGVTVNNGTVVAYGSGGSSGLGSGVVTVNSGGTLLGATSDAFGYSSGKYPTNIVINGGTVSDLGSANYDITLANVTFTGGTLTSAAGNTGSGGFTFAANGNSSICNISSIGATTTAIINTAGLGIERPINFNVAAGSVTGGSTPGVDLLVTSFMGKDGSHAGAISKNGAGTLEFTSPASTYAVGVLLSNGVLIVGGPQSASTGPLGSSSDVISMAGGTLRYSPANQFDYSGMFSSAAGADLLNIDVAGQNVTYAHALAGSGGTLTLADSVGGGTLTLSAADTYNGTTTINGGTLLVNGSLGSGSAVTIGTGALAGNGTVNGTVTTTANSVGINQEVYDTLNSGVGTLNLYGNADMSAGGAIFLDVSTSHVSGNDQIVMGASTPLTLNNTTFHINALGGSANLDATGDYILVQGGAPGILGTVNAMPVWDGTAPANSSQYVVEILGDNVVLHNTTYLGVSITASSAAPSSTDRYQSSLLSVTVTNGTAPYTVTVDTSLIGGPSALSLVEDGADPVYPNSATFTNSVTPSAGAALGAYSLPVTANDSALGSANANISFTYVGASLVWNGDAGGNSPWDTAGETEWQNNETYQNGDFARFDDTASGLDATNVNLLTTLLPGGVVVSNTAALPTGAYTFNASGSLSGTAGVIKEGSGTFNMFEGGDNFSGGILVEGGTLIYSNAQGTAAIAGGVAVTNNSTVLLDQFGTFSGGMAIASGSAVQLGNNDGYNQAPGGPWTLNGSVDIDSAVNLSLSSVAIGGASTGNLILDDTNIVTLGGANTFSGNILLNAGTLAFAGAANANGTQASLGNSSGGGRTITINTNATLSGTINNWFGGIGLADADFPAVIINSGTNITTRYTAIGNITLNNGAVLVSSGNPESQAGSYQAYQFRGSVTVGGSLPSLMTNATGKANHLGSNTVFNVAVTTGSGPDLTVTTPFWNQSGDYGSAVGGFTKTGLGTMLLLDTTNTYTGNTVISQGTLSLAGTTTLANTPTLIIAGGATFDVSGLALPFTLGAGQTLSNSTSTAVINCGSVGAGTGSGTISLTYASGTPSLLVTNGSLSLASTTAFKINNTGAPLTAGTYIIITNASAGNAGSVAGTLPSVTVGGNGLAGGATASLQFSGGALALVVTAGASPAVITDISVAGTTLTITATNGADGGQYVLLESTNLLLPLSQWVPVLTNNFDANGDLSLSTNIINPANPQEFYLLQMP